MTRKFIIIIVVLITIVICAAISFIGTRVYKYTSSNAYCISCHVHTHADAMWKQSSHFYTKSGVHVACVDCHLPPKDSAGHYSAKIKHGLRDLWAYYTKDSSEFDWQSKRNVETASKFTYSESCIHCHKALFTKNLSTQGIKAHFYYKAHSTDLNCINCHLSVGHYNPSYISGKNDILVSNSNIIKFTESAKISNFQEFTEKVPGTTLSFNMKAIPGGTFTMGSTQDEAFHLTDESPLRKVTVSPFYMAEFEVSWDEYLAFYAETKTNEKTPDINSDVNTEIDAISGPTAPYGNPDQGWGKGRQPAITMTWHAANIYCKWLSKKTGKKYRLPTEAEWEYACRAGTQTPYFFEGEPTKFSEKGFWRKFFDPDTEPISEYVIYKLNSKGSPKIDNVKPNPFGLKNMAGNVAEFCSDWYSQSAYSTTATEVANPKGPDNGSEHVIRGGSFMDDASVLRSAARNFSYTDNWLRTDPQIPKSKWWYSDCKFVGFRVVCETE